MYPRPMIIFRVNLTPPGTEAMGPITNQTMQGIDSPDNIVDLPNQTLINALKANRPNERSTASPAFIVATASSVDFDDYVAVYNVNNNLKHGQIVVLFGSKALQAKKLYCSAADGGQAIVKTMDIVYEGEPPATGP